jgi:hypothetical protein
VRPSIELWNMSPARKVRDMVMGNRDTRKARSVPMESWLIDGHYLHMEGES